MRCPTPLPVFSPRSVKIYPFIVAITKRRTPLHRLTAAKRGSQWIPYNHAVVGEEYEAW